MKKNYFLLAATTMMFAACAQTDMVNEVVTEETPQAIGFEGFAEKATRTTENNETSYTGKLYDHHNDFSVWAYKNTSTELVFGTDETVGTVVDAEDYTYDPLKYWDKTATKYEFFAAAPSSANWKFVGNSTAANQHQSYFMMENATLAATNFVTTPTTTHIESFKGKSGDIDWLIADKCPVDKINFNSTYQVSLNFIHILSRLNIIVKKSAAADPVTTLNSIKVKGLNLQGTFNENLSSANTSGLTRRWTPASPAVTTSDYEFTTDFELSDANNYVLQSFVIPQTVNYQSVKTDGTDLGPTPEAYVEIIYTISGEEFKAYYNLAEVFGATSTDDPMTAKVENKAAFNEGWENTLTITIAPDIINFTSGVAGWSTNGATENIE